MLHFFTIFYVTNVAQSTRVIGITKLNRTFNKGHKAY